MTGSRVRAPMIHGWTDGDSGRHLVIKQSTYPPSQHGFYSIVEFIIRSRSVAVQAPGQVTFDLFDNLDQLIFISNHQ